MFIFILCFLMVHGIDSMLPLCAVYEERGGRTGAQKLEKSLPACAGCWLEFLFFFHPNSILTHLAVFYEFSLCPLAFAVCSSLSLSRWNVAAA